MTENDATDVMEKCRYCKEDIKLGARKCIHCDSYLDWRRYLGMSSSVLALLIALVSVLTTALPAFHKYIVGNRSNLDLEFQASSGGDIYIVASNDGYRSGRVNFGELSFKGFNFPLNITPGDAYVAPGVMKPVTLKFDDGFMGQLTQEVADEFPDRKAEAARPNTMMMYPNVNAVVTIGLIQFGGMCSQVHFPVQLSCGEDACVIVGTSETARQKVKAACNAEE